MNKKEAKKKYYSKANDDFWFHAVDADDCIYINEGDSDLQKFRINLPEAPDWALIENFGLPREEQKFKYEKIPFRLLALEKKVKRDIKSDKKTSNLSPFARDKLIQEKLWSSLEDNRDDYSEEIKWIRDQWYFREFGKWYFINGKPTHLDGWNFTYMNYWNLEKVGLPEYRDRDRKWFKALRYCYTTTLTPAYDELGKIILLPDGTPKMIDMKTRTSEGMNTLKGRRVGDTSKSQCVSYCEASSNFEFYNGIQGNKETTARGIYEDKFLNAFRKMPFFFRPQLADFNMAKETDFTSTDFSGGLNSKLDYANTAKSSFYDSKKLSILHSDEVGKLELESVDSRHEVHRKCISPGASIDGLLILTSTVDDMKLKSGKEFQKLTKSCHFEKRGVDGRTPSGVINVYFPIYESYEGFIGPYGEPVINNPNKEQIPYVTMKIKAPDGHIMGCKEYLEHREKELRDLGDVDKLTIFLRQNPKNFRECFAYAGKNNFFNTELVKARLGYLDFSVEDPVRRGNFIWTNGFGSKVEWVDDPKNGRWLKSMEISDNRKSLVVSDGDIKRPAFKDVFIASCDPYKLDKVDGWRESLGGGSVMYKHDPLIDTQDIPVREYSTKKFVCTYLFRPPSKEDFDEDMLKMCIYWGSPLFPENNIDHTIDFFKRKGYNGYLAYAIDPKTGNLKNNPGFSTAGPVIKQKMFGLVADFINLHVTRCDHPEILQEFLDIEGPDHMKDHDLFVSIAGCLLGEESAYLDYMREFSSEGVDVDGWF
jgi:hypothetical protein